VEEQMPLKQAIDARVAGATTDPGDPPAHGAAPRRPGVGSVGLLAALLVTVWAGEARADPGVGLAFLLLYVGLGLTRIGSPLVILWNLIWPSLPAVAIAVLLALCELVFAIWLLLPLDGLKEPAVILCVAALTAGIAIVRYRHRRRRA
jgi:hypothetical protein